MKKVGNVALVVDWLTEGFGGGERVIRAVHELFPDAPIYTSQYRPRTTSWLGQADVRTGWLNALPVRLRRFTPFLRQWYFSRLNLSEYDVVISITGAEAKAVRTRSDALHISYMHAPVQYYWTLYDDYMKNPGFGWLDPLARVVLRLLIGPLRRADYKAAQRPDVVVANSSYIQSELLKHYGRKSTIIWPNVDIETIQAITPSAHAEREGFIICGRQVSWKRVDLAIAAAQKLGQKLVVVGDGPEHTRLVRQANNDPNILFLPRYNGVSDIVERIREARGFLFPSVEPFGIAPVEALAAGTPVIALKRGGSLDFIQEGENGLFFEEQALDSLVASMKKFESRTFDASQVAKSAERFSEAAFKQRLSGLINEKLGL